jgi:hypothetical protein
MVSMLLLREDSTMGWALTGAFAGAAGTSALNLVSYSDMLWRGRGSSELPAQLAGKLAGAAHLPLRRRGEDDERVSNRRAGLGALLGYAVGIGLGAIYGVVRGRRDLSLAVAAVALGATAMALSDVPAAAMKVTDPRRWGASGWAADLVPHLAYGLVTAGALELLGRPRRLETSRHAARRFRHGAGRALRGGRRGWKRWSDALGFA